MRVQTFDRKPRIVALRVFGVTATLLFAMLVFLRPELMGTAMSRVMILVN